MFSVPKEIFKLHEEYVKTHGSENSDELLMLMVEQFSEMYSEQIGDEDLFNPSKNTFDFVLKLGFYNLEQNDPYFNWQVEQGYRVNVNHVAYRFYELVATLTPKEKIMKELNLDERYYKNLFLTVQRNLVNSGVSGDRSISGKYLPKNIQRFKSY